MFRSRRRDVVYPQAEHGRLAGAIAAAWGNREFARPDVPFESFVLGVALHDRGYGELDADGIGEVPPERWLEIQRRGYAPIGEDPVVDLIVAMHVHRLVAGLRPEEAAALEAGVSLAELKEASGLDDATAAAIDGITDLCDRLAFAFCWEREASGSAELGVEYALAAHGRITLTPWPLAVPSLTAIVTGYHAAGYPEALAPVLGLASIAPA